MLLFLLACGEKDGSQDTAEVVEESQETQAEVVTNVIDDTVCQDDYAFCGRVSMPNDFQGEARQLVVALYDSIPPAGPPQHILLELDNPEVAAGELHQVVVHPVLVTGDYYIWVNLYMEGGGEWVPVNDVDYTGASAGLVSFDGSSLTFDDISLSAASGW